VVVRHTTLPGDSTLRYPCHHPVGKATCKKAKPPSFISGPCWNMGLWTCSNWFLFLYFFLFLPNNTAHSEISR